MTEEVPVTLAPIVKEEIEKLPEAAKKRLKRSVFIWIICVAGGLGMLGLVGYGYYLAFWPFKAAEAQTQPYIVPDKSLVPGEAITYLVDICRYTEVVSTVSPQLIGPVTINLPSYLSHLPTGCSKTLVSNNFVPVYTPPGKYYLLLNIDYQINPLRVIHKEFTTEAFKVMKATPTPSPEP